MTKVAIKKDQNKKDVIKGLAALIITLIVGLIGGYGINLAIRPIEEGGITIEASTIELSDTQRETIIETEEGEKIIDAPTVEIVDNGAIIDETTALGAWYDTSYNLAFYNSVGIGQCLNNVYGAQCFELANQFWWNYAGRGLSSCGTGAAKGVLDCDNAKDDFDIIWDAHEIQAGDWVVFYGGQYGHIGQALGGYNNGYVALFGQNQGGGYCGLGGSATNVINKSLKDFMGAFRPKDYIIPEPEPIVEPEVPDTSIVKE